MGVLLSSVRLKIAVIYISAILLDAGVFNNIAVDCFIYDLLTVIHDRLLVGELHSYKACWQGLCN